jgi:predicted dehydrogenase
MQHLRVYLIGAGAIARHHATALAKLPVEHSALAVADTNPATLADFVRQFPHARPFPDAAAMLSEPAEPGDIVVVATPPAAHAPRAGAALAGGRHVLCEKPLAMDTAQARELLLLARQHDRLLGCCSTRFLGQPTTEAVKQLVRSGALGRLYHATFVNRWQRSRPGIEYQPSTPWFLDRAQSGGGVVMDWGPYDFAVLNDVLAPERVEVLGAWMANPATGHALPPGAVFDVEEHAGASLRYHLAGGATLDVTYERAACTHGAERIDVELEGTAGAARWDWLMWKRSGEVSHTHDQAGQAATETTTYSQDGRMTFMDKPLAFFAQRVAGEPSPAIVNEQALFNFACLRAIYDCAATGRPQTVAPLGA